MKTDDRGDTKRMWETPGEMVYLPACLPQSPLTVLPAEVSRKFLSPTVLLAMSGVIGWSWAELVAVLMAQVNPGSCPFPTVKATHGTIGVGNRCCHARLSPQGPDCPQQGAKVDRQETKPVPPTLKG